MTSGETSQPIELLLTVSRDGARTLGTQIEDQLRQAIRGGALRSGARLPSTRDLARQLGVSRGVVVEAYAQLAAEGYLGVRQGARPRVSASAPTSTASGSAREPMDRAAPVRGPRFDFRPSVPDVSTFPRATWLRSLRHALATITDADLGYGDPRGVIELRTALSDYLGRVRGVVADPDHVIVTNGYTQGLGLVCRALAARRAGASESLGAGKAAAAKRIALETPSNPEDATIAARAGLVPVHLPVDPAGMRIEELRRAGAEVVVLTPAHQHPTGAVLSGERRAALLDYLRERDAVAIEDDYDAEYRYDRAAVRALQGLDPDRVVYAGTASKTLAPALRIGWLVVPPALLDAVVEEKLLADRGTARIEQRAFADFLVRGELDRHLRRMRTRYRARRDALIEALARALPDAAVTGVAAGLHVTVTLPDGDDEAAIREQALRRRIEIETLGEFCAGPSGGRPALVLGYAQMSEPAIRAGVSALAEAIRASRTRSPGGSREP